MPHPMRLCCNAGVCHNHTCCRRPDVSSRCRLCLLYQQLLRAPRPCSPKLAKINSKGRRYRDDQWCPLNPEGRKQYDQHFLLMLQGEPISLKKPSILSNVYVIKAKRRPCSTIFLSFPEKAHTEALGSLPWVVAQTARPHPGAGGG
ncbi:hypothetical protein HPB52_019481 [Rhipicephalus sanguineus]|uniref:Uncharacterized protein n=1 Tax=Rhipicephalus sanguineus TaxID=34632 RepID=A0A9D4T669_RHISA|nr:hypothetical protein HPB52_019481 [Rhipicephalus sanguineus]